MEGAQRGVWRACRGVQGGVCGEYVEGQLTLATIYLVADNREFQV